MKRLLWIDISKGLAILVVAYFHFFRTYFQYGVLPPPDWSNLAASALTILRLVWFKVSGLGFHAVGVFIILSGWTLMQSTMRRVQSGPLACAAGYFARYVLLVLWPQNGLWVLGGFAVCRLPEFALGMSFAMWHRQSAARVEWFLLRGAGFVVGLILYPAALQLYDGLYDYIFVYLAIGASCMLEIVGIAGVISRFNSPAKLFGLVGLYSYGLYLIHQPYVIWLGLRIREVPIWAFLLICIPTLAVLSAWGMLLEKATNALVSKLTSARKPERAA